MPESEAQKRIAEDLLSAGLRRGGAVFVHSSLRSMGIVPGGAETVIRGLLDALGPDGTLLVPALSYEYVDAARPVFDILTSTFTSTSAWLISSAPRTTSDTPSLDLQKCAGNVACAVVLVKVVHREKS